jgi:hypothetical protein
MQLLYDTQQTLFLALEYAVGAAFGAALPQRFTQFARRALPWQSEYFSHSWRR